MVRTYLKKTFRKGWFKVTYKKPKRSLTYKQYSPIEVDRFLGRGGVYTYRCVKSFDPEEEGEGNIHTSPVYLNFMAAGQNGVYQFAPDAIPCLIKEDEAQGDVCEDSTDS